MLTQDDESSKDELYSKVIPCVFGDVRTLEQMSNEWLIRSGQQQTGCKQEISLKNKLNGILGRLVTDYRAIFAIEVEFSRSFEK